MCIVKLSHDLLDMLDKVSALYAEYFYVNYSDCCDSGYTHIDSFIDAMNKHVKRAAQDCLSALQEEENAE